MQNGAVKCGGNSYENLLKQSDAAVTRIRKRFGDT